MPQLSTSSHAGVAAEPQRGEAAIATRAIGVNPIDRLLYSGAFGDDHSTLPLRLGQELAGVVTAAGPEAVGPAGPLSTGDEVIAARTDIPGGAYAGAVCWPAEVVVPKPSTIAWEQAAGLLFAGAAAVHALEATAVADGDVVLVHGASGAVGSIAAQVAIARGARAIGTADPRHHAALRSRGIEPVAYGSGLTERVRTLAAGGVDAAVDAAGTDEAIDASLRLVAERSRIATLVAFERGAEAGIRTLGSVAGATDPGTAIRAAAWAELIPLAAAGALEISIAARFTLDQVAAAHELLATGHAGGKIILLP